MSSSADWVVATNRFDRFLARLVYLQQRYADVRLARYPARWLHDALAMRGTDISSYATIGEGLVLRHGAVGVVIHGQTRIGRNVTIYQGVTIGRADIWQQQQLDYQGVTIEDGAILCAGAAIITSSELTVGAGSVIGANAVLTRSTGAREIWAGQPARLVGHR